MEHLHTRLCRLYSGKPLLERCDVCLALSCVDTRESLLIGCVHLGECCVDSAPNAATSGDSIASVQS